MNDIAKEATWHRALSDSESFRHSGKFFWGFEVLGAAAFAAIVTYFFLPDDPSRFESSIYPLSGVVTGFVAAYSLVYLWNLFRAPYRQRNEAHAALRALGASPTSPILATPQLFIECSEYEFGEPGKRGYPQSETGAARSLRVDIYLNTTNGMQVESIELEVQGKRIPSTW